MIEIIAGTAAPAAIVLAAAYPFRLQGGRMRTNPVPAREILARLADEAERGLIPAGPFGDTSRPPAFTVQPRRIVWRSA